MCDEIRDNIKALGGVSIKTIELDQLETQPWTLVSSPTRFDFKALLRKIDELEEEALKEDTKLMILIPGLYSLFDRELRQRASMKVFVDCDADTRLNRWITTDVLQNGNSLTELLDNYLKHARPEFNEFIHPTKEFADVVLPSEQSHLGISLICDGITPMLTTKWGERIIHETLYPRFGEEDPDLDIYKGQEYYELN